ncbi:sugar MFS transporter [Novosphingobium mangrovi (ex Huang et al. 2023)]|uniref:Sugar MFS transporter n=1 Tax=Novosphingobium mangrovi (ex Huang et al. 2023) TaxID=2976432 RepID=A0ABT2I8P7_9SPHN|nr:sugar MFS transporter [Novosphingobium mangrovi (ex Huang et al. 2023)]MCT2401182.1 sugar MFS transporter [Novosphingobium mangrovi (ex Huang et al. 2023)]
MPSVVSSAGTPAAAPHDEGVRYGPALTLLASLFFMWGFITVINNTLLPHLRSVFELTYFQAALIESVWFIAYFFASIPSALLIERIGYKKSLVTGLLIMATGALGMMLAASIPSYGVTLVMLFVIASGITLLQVAANPYVAVVGKPETASSRLNLVQAMNSAGTMLAPAFGAYLILGRSKSGTAAAGTVLTEAERLADAHAVILPYGLVAVVLVVLAVVIARFPLPVMTSGRNGERRKSRLLNPELLKHRNLVFGVPAIFIYLIAEIGVANLFINFVSRPDIGNMTHEMAGNYLSFLWGGMMVGRFAGSAIMQRFDAAKVLALFSIGAFVVMMITVFAHGPVAMWSLILVGLFHSIMFPTIFTLGIKGLGPLTEEASGLLVMAIAGGALVAVQGWMADTYGLQTSFLLTAACELYVLFYALWGSRPTHVEPDLVAVEPD